MKFYITILSILYSGTSFFAQDILFENPENKVILNFLDTAVSIKTDTVSVYIGPKHKESQNTIFFNGRFSISNSTISKIRIKGSFLRHLMIDYVEFKERAVLIDSTDFDSLYITNSLFKDSLIFRNVYIKDLRFNLNHFPKYLLFENCTIPNLDMHGSNLTGNVVFVNCKLGALNFQSAGFHKTLSFSGNSIDGPVNFIESFMGNTLKLDSLKIGPLTRFRFDNAILPDTIDFSGNPFLVDTINLTTVSRVYNKRKKTQILLNGTDVSRLRLNYEYFKVCFPKELSTDEKEGIYTRLLENLQSYSYKTSYKDLDIEYKRFRAKQGTFGFLWWVPDLWWQYGYDRGRIFKISFWSIIIFTFLNYFFFLNYMVAKVYPIGNIPLYYRKMNLSRLWFSFVYTSIIFFSLSIKVDRIRFQRKAGSMYLMLMYVFGIICLAYMANYIIQR